MDGRVKEARLRTGMSQGELALQAGVTRQLVGAIEGGRHSPSVSAALRIAAVLGESVETLFAAHSAPTDLPVSASLPSGTPIMLARVGANRVHAPVRNLLAVSESWAVTDGFLSDQGVETFSDLEDSALVIAGCDPLLGLAAAVLLRAHGPRILPVHLSTGAAVTALACGTVHGVVVHGRANSLPSPPVAVRRWSFASWRVGLASPLRREISSVEQLAERRVRTAQREAGAGTQRALERALGEVGATSVPGPRVDGHIDAARHVVAGIPAGITMEPAALAFNLGFLPLETHSSELWISERHLEHRGAMAFVEMLNTAALVVRARRLPAYDVSSMGKEIYAA